MARPNPGGDERVGGVIITIEPVCRNCNTNEPKNLSITDWAQVKQNLSPAPGWRCFRCGCRAAFWYVRRNVYFEEMAPAELQTIDEKEGYMQPFACTEDEGFPVPSDFDGTVLNPITRIAL